MEQKSAPRNYRPLTKVKHVLLWPFRWLGRYWRRRWWHKIITVLVAAVVLCMGTMYGIALWYINTNDQKPLKLGASFIPAYAESLGLDAKETMDAMINDLGIRHFRLVSYWNQLEPAQDQYDFSLLDWQFQKAEAAGAKVSLSLGLRQPRWPECHMPDWAKNLSGGPSVGRWEEELNQFITEVVNRYENSPALDSYQLENEFFLHVFSPECTDFRRERLVDEFNLVKQLDPYHPVILARSNNYGVPLGEPVPDIFGTSVYRRVWDGKTKRYFQYPLPPKWYAFHAGVHQLLHDKPTILHELQAEAWPPRGQHVTDISLEEQNKSINAQRLEDTFNFGIDTGMREIYLWGAEYWYYRMVELDDPSLWNIARKEFAQNGSSSN
jgi:hypothetical protein